MRRRAGLGHMVAAMISAVAVATAGCSDSEEPADAAPSACPVREGERPAKAVLRCSEDAVVFVATEAASGTGVVVEVDGERYVLTNEHVVDPFDAADLTIAGETFDAVEVVGVDASADIALLGPLAGGQELAALPIADGTDVERGDDVFLVGFPGENQSDGLEATIASGIVSRLRPVAEFDHVYIQTDTSIGGGQSGGPLFDAAGNLIGISGLSFAEEFALSLTGRDVKAAVDRIAGGQGDDYLALPATTREGLGTTSGSLRIGDASDGQVLFLPAAPKARTWNLAVDMSQGPVVYVDALADAEQLAVSGNTVEVDAAIERELTAAGRVGADDLSDSRAAGVDPELAARETSPGTFVIPVDANTSALVIVGAPMTDSALEVSWTSDLPLVPASRPLRSEQLPVSGETDLVIGGFDTAVDVVVDLDLDQEVLVQVGGGTADPAFMVFPPQQALDHLTMADPESAGVELVDDTDDGLYGLDARETIKAEQAGPHRLRVYSNDYNTVKVRVSVSDCAVTSCDG